MARPSLYTPEIIAAICDRLSEGEPMASICRDEGMPSARTVRAWMNEREDVSAAIARARDEGFDTLAEQCLDISDDEKHDWIMSKKGVITDEVAISRARLRVDTRLKLLAKWNPKKYGDSLKLQGDEENPIRIMDDTKLDSRITDLIGKAGIAGFAGGKGSAET